MEKKKLYMIFVVIFVFLALSFMLNFFLQPKIDKMNGV